MIMSRTSVSVHGATLCADLPIMELLLAVDYDSRQLIITSRVTFLSVVSLHSCVTTYTWILPNVICSKVQTNYVGMILTDSITNMHSWRYKLCY
jgi:hypothetical protein